MYYELKLRVKQINDKGEEKEVSEQYITNVNLFAEAECKGLGVYNGECDVTAIKRSNIYEIVNPNVANKPYFRATIVTIFQKDDGTEKELKYRVLVAADTVAEATRLVNDYMKQGMEDMRLDDIVKTKILDILD